MPMSDITLLICIDKKHIEELKFSYKTWEKYKPEITQLPKLIIYDYDIHNRLNELDFIKNVKYYPFKNKNHYDSQRSAMLTSFFEGISQIETKYYLKIDTDCVAMNYDKSWIAELEDRDEYVFITNPWGYTKGIDRIKRLEDWGDSVYPLNQYKRLNLPVNEERNRVKHKRIISWLFLGRTEWTNYMSQLCWKDGHYKLPDPSQDTFIWYCADRTKAVYKRKQFKKLGFNHGRIKKFKHLLEDKRIKLIIGAGNTNYDGWEKTDKKSLDITKECHWARFFKPNSVDIVLAEYVWEHLNEKERVLAAKNIMKYLKKGGFIRVAVPDGNHPDPDYIEKVKVDGTGKSAGDHKYLYTYKELVRVFEEQGFKANLLEYFDDSGNFVFNEWDQKDGHIKRSSRYDKRNRRKKLSYTSLIIDCVKE